MALDEGSIFTSDDGWQAVSLENYRKLEKENDRLKEELAVERDANEFLKGECIDFREKAELWDWCCDNPLKMVHIIYDVLVLRRLKRLF